MTGGIPRQNPITKPAAHVERVQSTRLVRGGERPSLLESELDPDLGRLLMAVGDIDVVIEPAALEDQR